MEIGAGWIPLRSKTDTVVVWYLCFQSILSPPAAVPSLCTGNGLQTLLRM